MSNYYLPPDDFFERGTSVEDFVMEATEHFFGGRCYRSEDDEQRTREDKYDHIDFWWDSPKKGTIGIDVKGIKKNRRTDNGFDDSIQWLELKGVSGHPGWLYGKAEYIAFKTNSGIVYARREKLAKYAEEKVKGKELVYDTPSEFYVPYQRKKYGKKDMVIKVPTSDIIKLADFLIEKQW